MIKITFKDVGQGDSILLEWENSGERCFGIIDCAEYKGQNPLLDEIRAKEVKHLDFLILSHIHLDHYSGMPELLKYLIENKITVRCLYHTFTVHYLELFKKLSQRAITATKDLIFSLEKAIETKTVWAIKGEVCHEDKSIALYSDVQLEFWAPAGVDYFHFAAKKSTSNHVDGNELATIITISNATEAILLTSDAGRKSFKRIKALIKHMISLAQAPHHGSLANLEASFWEALSKSPVCPVIFSVGDVKKDKLPKREVVEFFDNVGFHVESTNYVYGLVEHFGTEDSDASISDSAKAKMLLINMDPLTSAAIIRTSSTPTRFSGDKNYSVIL